MKIEILRTIKVTVDGEPQLVLKGTIVTDEVEPIHEEILLELDNPRTDFPVVKVLDPRPAKSEKAKSEKGEPSGSPVSAPKKRPVIRKK